MNREQGAAVASFQVKVKRSTLVDVRAGAMMIGTHPTCDLVLRDPVAAREHCRIRYDGAAFLVEDLGTATGTFLNGLAVEGSAAVSEGDELVVGVSRLNAAIGEEDGTPRLTFQLRANSFNIVQIGAKTPAELNTRHDRDQWVRSELGMGRFLPVRAGNMLAIVAGLALAAAFFWPALQEPLVDPGPLCVSHAQLFAPECPAGVPQEEFALAQAEGCNVCHAPFGGTPMSKCGECHGDLMGSQHPFHAEPTADLDPEKVSRAWEREDCLLCHVDHLGEDARDGGFVPRIDETTESCVTCHEGTRLLEEDFRSVSRAAAAVPPRERSHSSYAFGHEDHVGLEHRETKEVLSCETCHLRDEAAEIAGASSTDDPDRDRRDWIAVPYETCVRCHVQRREENGEVTSARDESLAGWWPEGEHVWLVDWHGTDDAARCQACHQQLHGKELKPVDRWEIVAADYTALRARYTLERRTHAEQFQEHAAGQACVDCHRREVTLEGSQRVEATFWHGVHVGGSLQPTSVAEKLNLSEDCAACHTDQAEALSLVDNGRDGGYRWTEGCDDCHAEEAADGSARALPLEAAAPARAVSSEAVVKRPDFPHRFHLDFRPDGPLAEGCFTCHLFESAGEAPPYAAIPRTKPEMLLCETCHSRHQNIAGGACQKCHPMDPPERYNVYLGAEPPADRALAMRSWPESNAFNHFSLGHKDAECTECHRLADEGEIRGIASASTLAETPIPVESDAVCRDCHIESKQRFHWR